MDDINLDFLKTPPKHIATASRTDSPFVCNGLNVGFGKKRNSNKRFEMAKNIAKVDELLQEIERLKIQNNELQKQLKDFQTTAQQVQELYSKEKQEHANIKWSLEKLEKEYQKIDVDLTNKNMVNEQMKARLAEYDGRPIQFNNLVVKYIKIMNKLEGEDILKYSVEKDLVERLREYCAKMKLKIPPINSPKKYKVRGNKVKIEHAFVQCNLMEEMEVTNRKECLNCLKNSKMKDQSTLTKHDQATQYINSTPTRQESKQSFGTKRDQASQYISTMITRQTNTEKIVQKHVQTMFPEPQKPPAIDDILNVYAKWSNIRSVSPLLESPSRQPKELLKTSKNTGTCTMLCNIRRKIDYLPPNNSSNIKQEIITPSASPTPNSLPLTSNRTRMSSSSDANTTQFNNTILNLFSSTQNSALGQLSSNAFNELWQIFGKMLLSLLQTSNAGIANSSAQNSSINQQQFLDWLLELYMNSQPQNNSSTAQTQTSDSNIATSPLCFNDTTILSANVIRPQPQKSLPVRRNSCGEGNNRTIRTETLTNNTSVSLENQQNSTTSPIPTLHNSLNTCSIETCYSKDSNSMDLEVQQIQNISSKQQAEPVIPSLKFKTKNKILNKLQELIPELKLNKKKRKALKRLLKKTSHRVKKSDIKNQKTFKTSTQINTDKEDGKGCDVEAEHEKVVVTEHTNAVNREQETTFELEKETALEEEEETAVDFLKTFVMDEPRNKEISSQTETLYWNQSSTNVEFKKPNKEFDFIKPSNTIPRIRPTSTTKSATTKRKKSKLNKNIENKLHLLFGDSDNELEEQEQQNYKAVITNSINLNENRSKTNVNNRTTNINHTTLEYNENWQQQFMMNSTNCNNLENDYSSKSCHLTLRDIASTQQQTLPVIATPIFENSFGFDVSKERFSIPNLPTPILNSLENTYFPETLKYAKDLKLIEGDSCQISEIDSPEYSDIENDIEKDLELSSDEEYVEHINGPNNNLNSNNVNSTTKALNNLEPMLKEQFIEPEPLIKQPMLEKHLWEKDESLRSTQSKPKTDSISPKVTLPNSNDSKKETLLTESIKVKSVSTNIKPLPKLNGEVSLNTVKDLQLQSPTPIEYPSDFEKDLELSSDNESETCDEEQQVFQEKADKYVNKSISDDIANDDKSEKHNQSHESNEFLNKTLSDNVENDHGEIENESLILEENQADIKNSEVGEIGPNIYKEKCLDQILKSTDLAKKDYEKLSKAIVSNNKTKSEIKGVSLESFNKDRENLESLETENNSNTPTNSENKILTDTKAENSKSLEENHQQNSTDSSNSTSFQKEQLNSSTNESFINKSEGKDNSLCWSVITISDSSSIEETAAAFNHNEMSKSNENKINMLNTKETENKTQNKGLSSLKLLNLNTTYKSSVNITNDTKQKEVEIKANTTESSSSKYLHKNPKQQLSIITEHNESLLNNHNILDEDDEEHELMIDETSNKSSSTSPQSVNNDTFNDTLNTSNISTLLNSSLYNEVLTESLNPIVDDLLNEGEENLINPNFTPETKTRRGRKRKSETITPELQQPCKRSQRLQAKQKILEEKLNVSKTPIELGKYTRARKNINNLTIKDIAKEEEKRKHVPKKQQTNYKDENIQMGFFRERQITEDKGEEMAEEDQRKEQERCAINHDLELEREGFRREERSAEYKHKTDLNSKTNTLEDEMRKQFKNKSIAENDEEITENVNEETTKREDNTLHSTDGHNFFRKTNESQAEYSEHFNNFVYTDSPQSPTPLETQHNFETQHVVTIPNERLPQFMPKQSNQTLLDSLINSYRYENLKHVTGNLSNKERQQQDDILAQFHKHLKAYCYSNMELDADCTSNRLINKLLSISSNYKLIQKAIITIAENAESSNVPEKDLPSIIQEMPPRHLAKCLQRLFPLLKNIINKNSLFCQELIDSIESLLFNSQQNERISLQGNHNLTQLYLMACKIQESIEMTKHPARLFIAKCLYFYISKAPKMIHEVLMWYPTALPYREDKTYDRSDALISVLQHILMTTKYEMDKPELHGKVLLSKLRYEYHFEPFKPSLDEVINVLIEKLKNSKFYNISLAFGLLCKRLGVLRTQIILLDQHLLPLANEYYNLAMKTVAHDKCIAVLLEIISMIVKPFPHETDTKIYFKEFARFLNAFERPVIQEAALCSILRLQRFNMAYCYNLLKHFKPTFDLDTHTQAMLNTFIYRRPLTYWKNLKSQNPIDFN